MATQPSRHIAVIPRERAKSVTNTSLRSRPRPSTVVTGCRATACAVRCELSRDGSRPIARARTGPVHTWLPESRRRLWRRRKQYSVSSAFANAGVPSSSMTRSAAQWRRRLRCDGLVPEVAGAMLAYGTTAPAHCFALPATRWNLVRRSCTRGEMERVTLPGAPRTMSCVRLGRRTLPQVTTAPAP